MKRQELIELITTAFRDVKLDDGISITQARLFDDYVDDRGKHIDARLGDAEATWSEIPDEKIERLSDALTFLDGKGFRFSLPAYMLYALRHVGTSVPVGDYIVYQLNGYAMERAKLLDDAQRDAVREYLKFCIDHENDFDAESARKAMKWW